MLKKEGDKIYLKPSRTLSTPGTDARITEVHPDYYTIKCDDGGICHTDDSGMVISVTLHEHGYHLAYKP